MDILRHLLGDEKLNYLGKSYGTYMGTLYAKLFPNQVGKFILDGAVDPTLTSLQQTEQQAVGFDSAFAAFAADCDKQSDCVFTNDPVKELETKLSEIRKNPFQVGNRKLTESLATYGIAYGLYDKQLGWPELRSALKALFAGDGKAIMQMADAYTGRSTDGKYATNEAESLSVISCNDFPASAIDANGANNAAPLFGKYVAYIDLLCTYLPHGKFEQVSGVLNLAAPVLVIGTSNDPATPYKWAVNLSALLTNSKLISLNSDGHTGYNRGSTCVDQAVEKYLISGDLPARNLACSA
jgi:pimeloyl-ACP methyl ester carboxylesterase